jgi:ATP-dependent Clp protease ATP-binding subunit ClpB
MTSNLKEEELKAAMRPEFLNRIDEIVVFDQLSKDDIREIVHIQMDILQKKLQDDNVELAYTKDFEDYMVEEGYSPEYGARPVKRLIQRELVNKLASEILQGSIRKDSKITADARDGKVILTNA